MYKAKILEIKTRSVQDGKFTFRSVLLRIDGVIAEYSLAKDCADIPKELNDSDVDVKIGFVAGEYLKASPRVLSVE